MFRSVARLTHIHTRQNSCTDNDRSTNLHYAGLFVINKLRFVNTSDIFGGTPRTIPADDESVIEKLEGADNQRYTLPRFSWVALEGDESSREPQNSVSSFASHSKIQFSQPAHRTGSVGSTVTRQKQI